jgi:hypothetical protein
MTVPFTLKLDVRLVPPKKPADMPEGADPLLVATVPEVIVDPVAVETATSAPAAAVIIAASLTALIPELPDAMTSFVDVVTAILPGPRLNALIP